MIFETRNTREVILPQGSPVVTIVVPLHNDEQWVGRALESCLAQTLADVEIVCVDDASTDDTAAVVDGFAAQDSRIRLIRQETNQSAYQARRVGILEASAPYVLFLDGDDELAPEAAARAVRRARHSGADLVGFGVELVTDGGPVAGRFEADLQPKHAELRGEDIVPGLFPAKKVAQGHLWRYLWSTELLRTAYAALPEELQLHRANDIPITMLAAAHAQLYVSMPDRLYRYFFRRGVSGRSVPDRASFDFYLSGLDSIDVIGASIEDRAQQLEEPSELLRSYESARLSAVQVILRYAMAVEDEGARTECLQMLAEKAGAGQVVRAVASFYSTALPFLGQHSAALAAPDRGEARTVLLYTGNLRSGGVQGVLVSQAEHLQQAGYRVVVAVRTLADRVYDLPDGVDVVEIGERSLGETLESFRSVCREYGVDRVIDHHLLYNEDWPYFVLMASTLGIRSIGWIHNFALRPVFDFSRRTAFLTRYLPLFEKVVTLSATDVAFWKMQGVEQAVYLPNPASPWLLEEPMRTEPRTLVGGPVRLVWWGRIQQHTKRVRELVDVAVALRRQEVDFRLTIVGPDSDDLSAETLQREAAKKGVDDAIVLTGPLFGEELRAELERSDLYVCTSAIEGYPLTLIEAQALGLPTAMYELPWLAIAEGNDGLITAPQRDSAELARKIAVLAGDPSAYVERSRASLRAAEQALSHDFTALYSDLLTGHLASEYSPEPTLEAAQLIISRAVDFHEQNVGSQGRLRKRLQKKKRAGGSASYLSGLPAPLRTGVRRLTVAVRDPRRGARGARRELLKVGRRVGVVSSRAPGAAVR